MKRITVFITDIQYTALQALARALGVPYAEVLRRLLDEALRAQPK